MTDHLGQGAVIETHAACAIKDCFVCRVVPLLQSVAAKCTAEEKAMLNELWGRMESAEMELSWRDSQVAPPAQ